MSLLLLLRPAFRTDGLGMVQHMCKALFVLSVHDTEFCPWLAGDITAEKLVEKKDFQVYLKMYCQAIKNGCRNAAWLGIRANDLVYPNVTLPDGTEYTYVYVISCQGEVTKNARGSSVLVKVDMAVAPDLSCCEKHASIERHKGHLLPACNSVWAHAGSRCSAVGTAASQAWRTIQCISSCPCSNHAAACNRPLGRTLPSHASLDVTR